MDKRMIPPRTSASCGAAAMPEGSNRDMKRGGPIPDRSEDVDGLVVFGVPRTLGEAWAAIEILLTFGDDRSRGRQCDR